jgi:hypothetical protein
MRASGPPVQPRPTPRPREIGVGHLGEQHSAKRESVNYLHMLLVFNADSVRGYRYREWSAGCPSSPRAT